MNAERWFEEQLDKFKDDVEFLTEKVILDFTEQVVACMEKRGINRAELAKRLGVSKAFITKLLNGNPNLTIKTMVSLAKTLDCDLNIGLNISPTKRPGVSKKQSGQVVQSKKSRSPLQL